MKDNRSRIRKKRTSLRFRKGESDSFIFLVGNKPTLVVTNSTDSSWIINTLCSAAGCTINEIELVENFTMGRIPKIEIKNDMDEEVCVMNVKEFEAEMKLQQCKPKKVSIVN
jgi:hypothetical protein